MNELELGSAIVKIPVGSFKEFALSGPGIFIFGEEISEQEYSALFKNGSVAYRYNGEMCKLGEYIYLKVVTTGSANEVKRYLFNWLPRSRQEDDSHLVYWSTMSEDQEVLDLICTKALDS